MVLEHRRAPDHSQPDERMTMAKRQSTSNATGVGDGSFHARRDQKGESAGELAPDAQPAPRTLVDPRPAWVQLEAAIIAQRSYLSQLASLLGCLHVALLHAGERGPQTDPDYSRSAEIALSIVTEAANRLDAAFIGPVLKAVAGAQKGARGRPLAGRRA